MQEKIYEKLKERWGVDSWGGIFLILFIFSITGMSSLYVRHFVFSWLGISAATPFWLEVLAWILIVMPAYQLLFLFYGFIFGQFDFVWNFEKKSLYRLKRLFVRSDQ